MNKGMYTKLAITNIKNNRQFYFPYLLTGIITVAMFYIMCALESNPGIQSMPGAKDLGLDPPSGNRCDRNLCSHLPVLYKQFHHKTQEKRTRDL